jgi:hypothetical protein
MRKTKRGKDKKKKKKRKERKNGHRNEEEIFALGLQFMV